VSEKMGSPGLLQRLILMSGEQVSKLGLLQKLMLGIFVPILLALEA
jgi:hypothetical protein